MVKSTENLLVFGERDYIDFVIEPIYWNDKYPSYSKRTDSSSPCFGGVLPEQG